MEKYCRIKLFDLQLDGKKMLTDFSFSFDGKKAICLLGESGSGKSLLLKALNKNPNLFETNGQIEYYFLEENKNLNWQEIVNFDNLDNEWQSFLNKFLKTNKYLSLKIALILKIISKPDFLFCEDLHNFLTNEELNLFLMFLKKQNIKIFYITNQVENSALSDYLIVIKNNKIAIEGKTISVLKEEKLMKLLGYSLPFYVNMSIQLNYYGILDTICLSKEELEEAIWKSN